MNDSQLSGSWAALEPTPAQRRRVDAKVREWLEARESSLAAQWLGLIRFRPIAGLGLAAVGACLVMVATPMSWVLLTFLR
jgi:hypothetical protein